MSWIPQLTALRNRLAALFPQEKDARRLVEEAQLSSLHIEFGGTATNNWHSILNQAHLRNKVEAIVQAAVDSGGYDGELIAAYEAYMRAEGKSATLLAGIVASSSTSADTQTPHSSSLAEISRKRLQTEVSDLERQLIALAQELRVSTDVVTRDRLQLRLIQLEEAIAIATSNLDALTTNIGGGDSLNPIIPDRNENDSATNRTEEKSWQHQFSGFAEPTVPGHFADRDQEINEIVRLVSSWQWCGIFGIGGTGKTTLAARVAQTIREQHHVRVVWLDLRTDTNIERILESLAQSVGYSLRMIHDPMQRYGYLREATNGKRLLIVFDDVNDNAIAEGLLKSVGNGNAVIVTGRNQGLATIIERGIKVFSIDPLPPDAAKEVLLKTANVAESSEPFDEQAWTALAESVGCLPLALEIVGGDIRFRSNRNPSVYREKWIDTGNWIKSGELVGKLKMTLDISIQQLDVEYQQAFIALSLFAGRGFTLGAVMAVCDFPSEEHTEQFLSVLRRRFLIRDELPGTFSLHPVLRQYAQEWFLQQDRDSFSSKDALGRYIAYYLELLRKHGGYEWNLGEYKHLMPHEANVINSVNRIFQLWQDAREDTEDQFLSLSVEATFLISWYIHWRGYWDMRILFCRRMTDVLEKRGLISSPVSRYAVYAGNFYVDRGWVHLHRHEWADAKECCEKGGRLLRFSTDRIFSDELHAQIQLESGHVQEAFSQFQALREQAKENTRDWFIFSYRFCDTLVTLGEGEQAAALLQELVDRVPNAILYQKQIISDIHARILNLLASLQLKMGKLAISQESFEKAVALFTESGIIDESSVLSQFELAKLLLSRQGKLQRARELLKNALNQARTLGALVITEEITSFLRDLGD